MAEPTSNAAFIVTTDGIKIEINPKVVAAVKKFFDGKLTGQITLHLKSGGIAGVEDKTVY